MTCQASVLAIVVVAIINNLLGMVWYSKRCFGAIWAKSHKFELGKMKAGPKHFIGSIVVSLVMASVVSCFVNKLGLSIISEGLKLGFFLWLGFVATTHFSGVIWCKKPFKVYLIDVSCLLIGLLMMGAILTAWK